MKPIDEDVASPPEDTPEDVDEVEAEIAEEIRPRRSRAGSRRRRSKLQQNGSIISFVVWMALLIYWLFFQASEYLFFQNVAVVFVALLIVMALNAVMYIPLDEGWKARSSVVSGVIWLVFLIVWIVFFAVDFGIFENIGIALASLLIIGAVNVMLWVPSHGHEGGGRISALGGIGWLTFMVLWLPFANDINLIYPIFPYKNVAIILASFLLMILVVLTPWRGEIRVDIERDAPGAVRRAKGSLVGFFLWLLFIVIWMWFFAGDPVLGFTGNQNVAIVLISFAVFGALILGMWLPWARRRGEGPENWWSIGLAFVWVIFLALWFWFFAGDFNDYQNFAVFLISLLILAAIGGGGQWKRIRDFEAMDWDD